VRSRINVVDRLRYGTSQEFRARLKELLLALWPGQDSEAEAVLADILDRVLEFFNGDLFQGMLRHYCQGCHATRGEAVAEACRLLEELIISHGVPQFVTTRWLKLGPGLKWFGRALLIHNLLLNILERFKLVEEDENQQVAGKGKGRGRGPGIGVAAPAGAALQNDGDAPREEIGRRLKKARAKFATETCRFFVVMSLFHMVLFDSLAKVLFAVSTVTLRRRCAAGAAGAGEIIVAGNGQ
jgi:hypothetical protein